MLARVAKMALDAGVNERAVQVAERQGELFGRRDHGYPRGPGADLGAATERSWGGTAAAGGVNRVLTGECDNNDKFRTELAVRITGLCAGFEQRLRAFAEPRALMTIRAGM
jgi:hypothetical protein